MDQNSTDDTLEVLQQSPGYWIEEAFGENLWDKEREIAEALVHYNRVVVKSAHGIGKSFSSARLVLWYLNSFPQSKVITTAPTWTQVENILWREIRSAKAKSIIPLPGDYLNTKINIAEEWFAIGLSTNDSNRIQGFHSDYILVVVDEAAGVEEMIFEGLEGLLSSQHAKLLMIGNPTNIGGTFYNAFQSPNYAKIKISAFDSPNFTEFGITIEDIRNNTWEAKITHDLPRPYLVTPAWVYDKYLSWGEGSPMWEARVLGEFPTQGDDTLIPLQKIEDALVRELPPNDADPEQTGIDVARYGSNKTLFVFRKGPRVLDVKVYNHMDTVETTDLAEAFAIVHPNAHISIDVVGVGAGVYDNLKRRQTILDNHVRVNDVNVGQQPRDNERFFNLRAEIYWALRERFFRGDIDLSSIKDQRLKDDLAAQVSNLKFKITTTGKVQIESKEEMTKRGLPSPDIADALALAFGTPTQSTLAFATIPTSPVVNPNAVVVPNAQSENVPALGDEDQRKQAELQADLDIIAQMKKGMRQS